MYCMLKRLFAAATLTLLAGCDSPSAIDDYSLIHAEARAATLSVSNVGARPVHYAVYERVDAGTVTWSRCTPANAGCPTLEPGATVRIPYAEIALYDDGDTEAIVYWWESQADGSGAYTVGRTGSIIVRL
ncbi:MAG TPA: hypothetical protein VHG93_25370 [Longimicrobium sp.]|nr:hypothetical protein [Longimicrobium sp.]